MPTKRTKRTRNRVLTEPNWAEQMKATGKPPRRGTGEWHEFLGWLFFDGAFVPGHPDSKTDGLGMRYYRNAD